MERRGEQGAVALVGVVGTVAVTAHAVLVDGSPVGLALHALTWAVALAASVWARRQLRIVSRAVRRARAAVDLLDDAVLVVDAATNRVVYSNLAAARLADTDVRELIGRRLWDAGPWPELEEVVALLDGDAAPARLQRHGRSLQITATRVAWVKGEQAYVLRARDVTERDEAQRDLAERERRFRALAEDAAGVVYRIRLQPRPEVEYVSGHLHEILGHPPEAWYRDPALLVRSTRPEHRAALDLTGPDHVYDRQGVHSYCARRADGRWVWLEDHHTPEHDADGELVAVQGIVFDVTARWETELALGEAQRTRELAAQTMARTARVEQTFLQSISHELRTPMTSALGFARMLLDRSDVLTAEQRARLLERLVGNIERIEHLVRQLLDFDHYARGDLQVDRHLERLDEVVAHAAAAVDLEGRVLEQDLELVLLPVDPTRLEQLVVHLLDNVVRHTPPTTTARLTLTAADDVVRLVVEDDGPGIDATLADHLFDPFTQGPASHEHANPGVGLGLAMVRVACRLHGGEVRHEPVEPHGARFVVELPLAAADQEPASSSSRA